MGSARRTSFLVLLFCLCVSLAQAFHLGDDENHCWIQSKLSPCPPSFDLLWIQRPPELITSSTTFNATYSIVLGNIVTTGTHLIAHANLHACPQDIGFCDVNVRNGTASSSGAIVTQEAAQVSNKTVIFSSLRLAAGQWTIVAHLRVFSRNSTNDLVQLDVARAVYRTVIRSSCSPGFAKIGVNDDGEAQCAVCSIGSFSNVTDSPSCRYCAPGTFQPDNGKTSCLRCPEGYFQDRSGQGSCLPCPGFTYSDGTGVSCKSCPFGSFTSGAAKSVNECICEQGYYSASGNSSCATCPSSGICCACNSDSAASWNTITSNLKSGVAACTGCRNGTILPIAKPGFYPASERNNLFSMRSGRFMCRRTRLEQNM
ncbi:hypothetical protein BC829DRAFT_254309 [Chytridium lagenaria]|nr:hypothetical protein BC829DRAFT_254309 [Chytridium lagenaria]